MMLLKRFFERIAESVSLFSFGDNDSQTGKERRKASDKYFETFRQTDFSETRFSFENIILRRADKRAIEMLSGETAAKVTRRHKKSLY